MKSTRQLLLIFFLQFFISTQIAAASAFERVVSLRREVKDFYWYRFMPGLVTTLRLQGREDELQGFLGPIVCQLRHAKLALEDLHAEILAVRVRLNAVLAPHGTVLGAAVLEFHHAIDAADGSRIADALRAAGIAAPLAAPVLWACLPVVQRIIECLTTLGPALEERLALMRKSVCMNEVEIAQSRSQRCQVRQALCRSLKIQDFNGVRGAR